MAPTERFVYHGNATVLSGHVHKPGDVWLDVGGASALPMNGGVSSATLGEKVFKGVLAFDAASTHAQGEDHDPPSKRRGKSVSLTSKAHTGAEVRGLRIGSGRLRLTAARIRAELSALCPCHAPQPSITSMDLASIEGLAIGPYKLTVAIDRAFFKANDTHDKLCAACVHDSTPARRRAIGFTPSPLDDEAANPDSVETTIVKSLRWADRPFPKATIDRHILTIPKFGQIFFGELIVTGTTRRLTMLRFALEGDLAVDGACCQVEAGGDWMTLG